MDKKDHYVKRCVATPGDTLEVRDGLVWINSQQQEVWPGVQLTYRVTTDGHQLNTRVLEDLGINVSETFYNSAASCYPALPLTSEMLPKVKAMPIIKDVALNLDRVPSPQEIFPFSEDFRWSRDSFGPLWVPAKGHTVTLTTQNLPLYERIISVYEGGDVAEALAQGSYTFKQDYYFMMGDNRHNSLDSRYWGFVPEDHVVGTPGVIWLSTDSGKSFPKNIRWRRFFKFL